MFNKKLSPTLCASPWTGLYLNTMGRYFNCCLQESFSDRPLKNSEENPYHASEAPSLEEIWNSQEVRDMRKEMLAGRWPDLCKACKDQEEAGLHSFRNTQNHWFEEELKSFSKKTKRDGSHPFNLKRLDIKPGNDCNLRCNMCGPRYSRKTLLDWKEVFPNIKKEKIRPYLENNWYEQESFWEQLFKDSSQLEHLHFAGGEPFLSPKLRVYLEKLVETGVAQKVKISFNTNLTEMPEELFKALSFFKQVDLHISLDATGPLNDFIRFPSQWKKMQINLKALDAMIPGSNFGVVNFNPVVQVYNMFHVVEFAIYAANNFENISPLPSFFPLEGPPHHAVTILPEEIREKAAFKIHGFCELGPTGLKRSDHWEELKKSLLGLARYYQMGRFQRALFEELLEVTEKFNKIRGMDLYDLEPDLAQMKTWKSPEDLHP